ncbi:MAG: hypothetical protein V1744_04945 [Candidatus Altiarchaeota archaeon]
MSQLGSDLFNFMLKLSGKSGGLILVNELEKLGVTNVDEMDQDMRFKLLEGLSHDYLSTFLGHSRFLVARAELVSILGISLDSHRIHDRGYRPPQSPEMFGKPVP